MSRSLFHSYSVLLSLPFSQTQKTKASWRFTVASWQDYERRKPRFHGASRQDSHSLFVSFIAHTFTRSFHVSAKKALERNPNSQKREYGADKKRSEVFRPGRHAENNPLNANSNTHSDANRGEDHQNYSSTNGGEILGTVDLTVSTLFEHETTKEVFGRLQSEVHPKLVQRLKQLSEVEAKYEIELVMADYAYLLKLLSLPNPRFQTVAQKAGEGSKLLQEGVELIAAGRKQLRSALNACHLQAPA